MIHRHKISEVIPSEHSEQATFVTWFELMHPGVRIMAIPNGGVRHWGTAKKLKAEGVSKGVPDLFIPAWRMWIEMKRRKKSSTSAEQKSWHEYLISIGDTVIIARGCDDAVRQVRGD